MLDVRAAARDDVRAAAAPEPVTDLPDDPTAVRAAAGVRARSLPAGTSALTVNGLAGSRLTAFVEGLVLGGYRFGYATDPAPAPTRVDLHGVDGTAGSADVAAIERGLASAAATSWARDLANTPAGTKTPDWLARQAAAELEPRGVTVDVHDEHWLAEQGFGGVLAVGAGSASPPRLIEASWRPRGAAAATHLVLVGKGITFDTGGVNRKLGDGMRTMHTDMSGGAAVLAALRTIAERRLPVRVTALVPAAENALSGSSYRPGDVVRHYGGRTSEIRNTDAEGRIVLGDALAYAVARLRPTAIVDVATLTGAMKIALGLRTGGLFATSDALADELLAAGTGSGEPLWRLPMPVEYASSLRSDVADANNAPGNPGAITAALFLEPFVRGVPWAHLDIAGPARAPRDDGMFGKGGTGFGARLLSTWVEARA
ncbi:leucyl aminopeptidase [Jatrophihabitans endophyticus]|uniref:Probable cytosol aminopeptidase n=1 Tax=Jatrophihabitans endophyticus TaxID=1206085 RepID=A0A1M5TB39_9ACTN|nr:leucyl aminopeptidase family protein [Jatrophihabitans endophyticus]SHH48005.1 leucyl aminopeptidase [Jatrophihabitans endophyticus]